MLEKLRQYFIFSESQVKLYLLAILTGLIASLVITCFRILVNYGHILISPVKQAESFKYLPWEWVLALPICGGLLIGLLFFRLSPEQRNTGVVHVIERLSSHEGRLPWRNAVIQFFGAAIALITGHSIGREGPSVHLGAASGSVLATSLELPNNHVRVLLACGTAAGISASFNTPIAGVIFSMEVIMMEYHIASFLPVILASVTGAVISRLVFGETALYANLTSEMHSLWELPYIIFMGIVIGTVSTGFVKSLQFFSGLARQHPYWLRTTYAGILIGLGGLIMPEIMGMSYNAISGETLQNIGLISLLVLMVLKLILSTASVGLGIPGGSIGPLLVIGASAGASLGIIGAYFQPDYASSISFYAVLGMCAMMAATLKAPLAALMALLELTGNPHIILPGMLTIAFSSLISQDFFKNEALFITLLRARGLDYKNDPLTQTLRRISVANALNRSFIILPQKLTVEEAIDALSNNPEWILIKSEKPLALLPAADLAHTLNQKPEDELDLMQIPATRRDVRQLSLHCNLSEAAEALNKHQVEALYISRITAPMIERTYGVLTREMIETHYQLPTAIRNKQ